MAYVQGTLGVNAQDVGVSCSSSTSRETPVARGHCSVDWVHVEF